MIKVVTSTGVKWDTGYETEHTLCPNVPVDRLIDQSVLNAPHPSQLQQQLPGCRLLLHHWVRSGPRVDHVKIQLPCMHVIKYT